MTSQSFGQQFLEAVRRHTISRVDHFPEPNTRDGHETNVQLVDALARLLEGHVLKPLVRPPGTGIPLSEFYLDDLVDVTVLVFWHTYNRCKHPGDDAPQLAWSDPKLAKDKKNQKFVDAWSKFQKFCPEFRPTHHPGYSDVPYIIPLPAFPILSLFISAIAEWALRHDKWGEVILPPRGDALASPPDTQALNAESLEHIEKEWGRLVEKIVVHELVRERTELVNRLLSENKAQPEIHRRSIELLERKHSQLADEVFNLIDRFVRAGKLVIRHGDAVHRQLALRWKTPVNSKVASEAEETTKHSQRTGMGGAYANAVLQNLKEAMGRVSHDSLQGLGTLARHGPLPE